MKILKLSLFLAIFAVLYSCEKEPVVVDTPNNNSRILKVSVSLCNPSSDPFCEATTPINADVSLYLTEDDRSSGTSVVASQTTSGGFTQFNALMNDEYYIKTVASGYGLRYTYETVSNGSIANHEVIYQ